MSADEPLRPPAAKKLIQKILTKGSVTYVEPHAREAMEKRRISIVDCVNVLRGGSVAEAEYENGAWRYRVGTQKIVVVVEFVSENELFVITAWRLKS